MPSGDTLKVGDRVAVPWGVDIREGEVVAVYETGAVQRVVVRLTVPEGGGDESPTVVLPADSVTPLSEGRELPAPGSWLHGFRYEREVAGALTRVLADLQPVVRLNAEHLGREVDILVESEQGIIVTEVKTLDHLSERQFNAAMRQLREFMVTYPDAKGLLVTSGSLPNSVRKRVNTRGLLSRNLGTVRWRQPGDDKNLRTVVYALLNDDSDGLRATGG